MTLQGLDNLAIDISSLSQKANIIDNVWLMWTPKEFQLQMGRVLVD